MNRLFLFAMLLLVTQAPVPVPGQTANSPTASSGQTNSQSKGHNAPPEAPMAVVQPVTTAEGQDANRDHTKDNATYAVIVRELPTVTIAKGGFDWATLANYLLVVVGFGGIGVALWTLCFIRKQVGEMTLQRGVMQQTLSAIKRQAEIADKTIVLQFRPKVIVRGGYVQKWGEGGLDTPPGGEVGFILVNTGGTPAKITDSIAAVNYAKTNLLDGGVFLGNPTLQPGEEWLCQIELTEDAAYAIQLTNDRYAEWRDDPSEVSTTYRDLGNPLYFVGYVSYTDDLGLSRSTKFLRRYAPESHSFVTVDDAAHEYVD